MGNTGTQHHSRLLAISILFVAVIGCAGADDLDTLVANDSTVEQRSAAYCRLAEGDFASFAGRLATLIGTHPVLTGIGPRTKTPWLEAQLVPSDRIGCTLSQLWNVLTPPTTERGRLILLLLEILEQPAVGAGRSLVIEELKSRLHYGIEYGDKTLPPLHDITTRLGRFARDDTQPTHLRRRVVEILLEHGDPNEYLDLAIALSNEGDALRRSETFRFTTTMLQPERLTAQNRKRYLSHCVALLESIDDGRTGKGYFLAMHIGRFVGVKPVRPGQGAFAPDQRRQMYQADGGLNQAFFQDTVNNARRWLRNHPSEYR